jgi:hypothetical protein
MPNTNAKFPSGCPLLDYTIVSSAITGQSISPTKELRDTKLIRNDGAYKIEDNMIDGVHFTVPTPL